MYITQITIAPRALNQSAGFQSNINWKDEVNKDRCMKLAVWGKALLEKYL